MILVLLLTGRVMMGADSSSLRIMANLLSSAPANLVLDRATRHHIQCTVAALSEKTRMYMKHWCTCCRHMPTCKISVANPRSEFVIVPLGLALDMAFDDTSDEESQHHTNGLDSTK
eukprot:8088419-Ditylum_brightwellii.AAC.1